MPHAIQIRQTGGPEVLNWTTVDVGEPGSGQVRLRQAAAGLDRVAYAGPTGGYSEVRLIEADRLVRLPEPISFDCLRPRGLMVTFGQASGPIDPIAPVLLSQKGLLFLTRPLLLHYIERRDALEASANELFEVVVSGKVRINVNQRFALKDVADAHKALEARATSGSTVLTI
jgi:NADPH:quinone reductase-like Zn-dependent oxidoreductase